MSFDVYVDSKSESKKVSNVDYDKLNSYVVETAGMEEATVLPGVISMIVDLGVQAQSDAEYVFDGDEEQEAVEIKNNPNVRFETRERFYDDGKWLKNVRVKVVPQRDVQSVAMAIDFPDVVVDKGAFFGDSKPLPLRIWMGGQFYVEGTGMIIQNMIPLKETNLDTTRTTQAWSLNPKSTLYKMAKSAKLVKDGEVFRAYQIDKLLGTAHQFEAQVFFKKGTNGKSYYTEKVKFVGALSRGQTVADSPVKPMIVQFNKQSPEEAVKELRAHVVNTMKRAKNYDGSVLQKQIEELRGSYSSEAKEEQEPVKETAKSKVETKIAPEPEVDDDPSLPF